MPQQTPHKLTTNIYVQRAILQNNIYHNERLSLELFLLKADPIFSEECFLILGRMQIALREVEKIIMEAEEANGQYFHKIK